MKRSRKDKEKIVATLHASLKQSSSVFVTRQVGLSVAGMTDLRENLREANANFRVTKNRLARLALDKSGHEKLEAYFEGPTAIAFSNDDPVALAKAVMGFAKKHDGFEVVAGRVDEDMLDAEQIKALATLPSMVELQGKIIGLLQAPASKLTQLMQTPARQVAQVTKARAEQNA